MDILLTGDLSRITPELGASLESKFRKVVFSGPEYSVKKKRRQQEIKAYPFSVSDEKFTTLFHTYSLSCIVFFSKSIDGNLADHNELGDLQKALELASQFKAKRFIYVTSSDVNAQRDSGEAVNLSKDLMGNPAAAMYGDIFVTAAQTLCSMWRETEGLPLLVVRLPHLFSSRRGDFWINDLLKSAAHSGYAELPDTAEPVDFIYWEEVEVFIERILDYWSDDLSVMDLSSNNPMNYKDLAEIITSNIPCAVKYISEDIWCADKVLPAYSDAEDARRIAGWLSLRELNDDLPELVEKAQKVKKEKKENPIRSFFSKRKNFLRIIVLLVLFVFVEFLNDSGGTFVQFKYVDLRLVYVVIIASFYGYGYGLAAAVLECISCAAGFYRLGVDWQIIFYNVNNWLPFIMYILAGFVVGYNKSRNSEELRVSEENRQLLSQKYDFLREQYEEALENKAFFQKQIVSQKYSFGNIYEAMRRLSAYEPELLLKESLAVMEDILDNRTISIYAVDKNLKQAHLNVCSHAIRKTTSAEMSMDEYSKLKEGLQLEEVWNNTEGYEGYPDYCIPIYLKGKPALLIIINNVPYKMRSLHFSNLLKVIGNIIQDSFERAILHGNAGKKNNR